MSFAPKQKNSTYELQQPKLTSRTRFYETLTSKINNQDKQKSITKSPSIKYLKEISPKRSKSNSKFISNKILQLLDRYQQTLNNSDCENTTNPDDFPHESSRPNNSKIAEALKTIDYQQQRNCQTTRPNYNEQRKENKISIKQNMLENFQSNQAKIVLMRQNLQKIFTNYKQREGQIAQMKSALKNKDKIKSENNFLSQQISRVQQMIKEALLERQKLKHGPFSQITKRTKK